MALSSCPYPGHNVVWIKIWRLFAANNERKHLRNGCQISLSASWIPVPDGVNMCDACPDCCSSAGWRAGLLQARHALSIVYLISHWLKSKDRFDLGNAAHCVTK